MRHMKDIATIINDSDYSLNTIIVDAMKKFKMKTLCHRSGLVKQAGHDTFSILSLLLLMPLMAVKSVNQLLESRFSNLAPMKKDTFYRFKNSEKHPWRSLLMCVAKMFKELTSRTSVQTDGQIRAFILDDTADVRTGKTIEGMSRVFDHTLKKTVLGFKHLVLAFFDGVNTIPVDFSLHSEKPLTRSEKKKQFKKDVRHGSAGSKRRKELKKSKIDQGLAMIKRALKHGFMVDYVLCDSWFTSLDFIQTIRALKGGAVHVIAGIRADKRKYVGYGGMFNAKEIIQKCKEGGKAHRCRSKKIYYYETIVNYDKVGNVKLLICRYPGQKKWRIFISTDTTLSFLKIMTIYGIRWNIETLFQEAKEHLGLGKCQSQDFDAQIANATVTHILYILLTYIKQNENNRTIGELCRFSLDDIREKATAEIIWGVFDELLSVAIDNLLSRGVLELTELMDSQEYKLINDMITSSFLSKQLQELAKSA